MLSTFRVADVSTAHITESDADALGQDAHGDVLLTSDYPEGFWVRTAVAADPAALRGLRDRYSEAFVALLVVAHRLGCSHIRLDADGEIYPSLPTYDW